MGTRTLATLEEAEAAWAQAFISPAPEELRSLLHPRFVAVHGPVGAIDDAVQFIAQVANRPTPSRIKVHTPVVHEFGDAATVACLQEWDIEFTPGAPPFVIQAAVTRVWIRNDGNWRLAQLQMSRRFPPG